MRQDPSDFCVRAACGRRKAPDSDLCERHGAKSDEVQVCIIEGCERPVHHLVRALLCKAHYDLRREQRIQMAQPYDAVADAAHLRGRVIAAKARVMQALLVLLYPDKLGHRALASDLLLEALEYLDPLEAKKIAKDTDE